MPAAQVALSRERAKADGSLKTQAPERRFLPPAPSRTAGENSNEPANKIQDSGFGIRRSAAFLKPSHDKKSYSEDQRKIRLLLYVRPFREKDSQHTSFVLLLRVLSLSRTRPSTAGDTSYGTVHFVGITTNKVLLTAVYVICVSSLSMVGCLYVLVYAFRILSTTADLLRMETSYQPGRGYI